MPDSPIQHVSDTAFWVATFRAQEGERKDALFHDPLAACLVEGRGRAITAKMRGGKQVGWSVVVRTCIIDAYITAALAEGVDVVLNLGAGLDTRPYRMTLPPGLRWIEVDFDDVIAFKAERLAGEAPRCALERVGLDLGDRARRRALFSQIAAASRRALVLTEGVIPYLSNDDVAALAEDLGAAPFASWVLDYLSPQAVAFNRRTAHHRRQMTRAPFKFAPGDWHAFFAARGWQAAALRYLAEESVSLGRPPPMPWWLKFVMRRGQREQLRRSFGYALMKPI